MLIDLDSAKIIHADTAIEGVPVRTVVISDAYVERGKTDKPQTLVCLIGDAARHGAVKSQTGADKLDVLDIELGDDPIPNIAQRDLECRRGRLRPVG